MNYLYYEPASITASDRVYQNGKLLEHSSQKSLAYDQIANLFRQSGNSTYPWIGKVSNFYLVRGLFDAKDELGRTLSFLFASDNDDFKNELDEIAHSILYSVDAKTNEAIDDFLSRRDKKKKGWKLFSLFLIVVLVIILSIAVL